ncbi:LysR family transcriptional regulator [Buttiauxella sp. WJP83]|uniref:LysR family transcriptional regulator n=1 Tax=Buttiauxella sp. WJP83 TaxID=2986951 RepID=UPI0022DD3DD8|nr:LysR family transcriptional regulator [Buttiauxella sp. WJP83]WBM69549.1 LysR family transcriptional regulator [Buttiauxella sp. WJP83]
MDRQKLPTLKQLQCFLAVAEELNFRRAAEKMNMTQPPLTRQIQCLEETIGCSVFSRSTHAVQLTPAGILLASKAQTLISELSQLVHSLRNGQHSLRIGMTNMLDFQRINRFSSSIKQMEENEQVVIHADASRKLLMSLMSGEIDLVFSGEKALVDSSLVYTKIHTEPLMTVIPESHPAASLQTVAMEDVSDIPLFWFPRNYNVGYFDKCDAIFKRLRYELKKIKEPEDLLMLLNSVAKGKGIALMPQSMSHSTINGLCYRPLTKEYNQKLNIDVYLVHRINEDRKQVVDAINQIIKLSD